MEEPGAGDDPDRAARGDLGIKVNVASAAVWAALGHGTDADGREPLHLGDHAIGHLGTVECEDVGPAEHLTPIDVQMLMDEGPAQLGRRDIACECPDETAHVILRHHQSVDSLASNPGDRER